MSIHPVELFTQTIEYKECKIVLDETRGGGSQCLSTCRYQHINPIPPFPSTMPKPRCPNLFVILALSWVLLVLSFSSFSLSLEQEPRNMTVDMSMGTRNLCECFSRKSSKSYDFCYQNPRNSSLLGRKFNCNSVEILEDLGLLEYNLPATNPKDPELDEITVTAFSDNHYLNFVKSHRQFRKQYPTKKVIAYGLNLTDSTIQQLQSHFSLPPDNDNGILQFRAFNYSKYPDYVGNWMEYRFKFLILAEVLKEYRNVWWNDAHNTIHVDGYMEKVYASLKAGSTSPILSNVHTMHSNLAVLNPGILIYFPVSPISMLKTERQLGANNFYIARTPQSLEILKWMVLCSLEKDCMAPPGAQVQCAFSNDSFGKWGRCFRFDQSVLNLLLLNLFGSHEKFKSPVAGVGNAGRV